MLKINSFYIHKYIELNGRCQNGSLYNIGSDFRRQTQWIEGLIKKSSSIITIVSLLNCKWNCVDYIKHWQRKVSWLLSISSGVLTKARSNLIYPVANRIHPRTPCYNTVASMGSYFILLTPFHVSLNCYKPVACLHPLNITDRLSDWPIYSHSVHWFCSDAAATSHLGAQPWTYAFNSGLLCQFSV